MKKVILYLSVASAVLFAAGCAKNVSEGPNTAQERFFNAWISTHHPDAEKAGRGIYILSTEASEYGAAVSNDGFAILKYKTTDLSGNITSYTDTTTAEQLGKFSHTTYYGPQVLTTTAETIRAGVFDGINGLRVGSRRTFVVPAWLMSYKNYGTEAEYLSQASENSNTIYDVEVVDFTTNINDWQFSQIARNVSRKDFYNGIFEGTAMEDSTAYGLYYKEIKKVAGKKEFPSDTTIYINYTGSLLNGLVFDTTIENVAKDHGLYSSGKSYEPSSVQWAEKYTDIKLGGNTVIEGFARTLWQMSGSAPGTKVVGVFYSGIGYGYSGSGSIPAYAPLVFEIEIVEAPKN
jgi:FKBP-type peptidyl-prolyl cis-trans isomerase